MYPASPSPRLRHLTSRHWLIELALFASLITPACWAQNASPEILRAQFAALRDKGTGQLAGQSIYLRSSESTERIKSPAAAFNHRQCAIKNLLFPLLFCFRITALEADRRPEHKKLQWKLRPHAICPTSLFANTSYALSLRQRHFYSHTRTNRCLRVAGRVADADRDFQSSQAADA